MTNTNSRALARTVAELPAQEQALIQQMGYEHIPMQHLQAFLHTASTLDIDPRLNEVTLIERKSKNGGKTYTVQVGIAGYRKAARRVADAKGIRLGSEEWQYMDGDGVWHDVWLSKWGKYPAAARSVIYRDGEKFSTTVSWEEYAQMYNGKPMALWESKPSYMLGKVAESLNWRKVFPDMFSGTYVEGEFDKDNVPPVEAQRPVVRAKATRADESPELVKMSDDAARLIQAGEDATALEEIRGLWEETKVLDLAEAAVVQNALAAAASKMKEV